MLSSFVASIFAAHIGKYVRNLNRQNIKISLWNGDLVLENLEVNPRAFDVLDLPVIVHKGTIGKLHVKIPWSTLSKNSCIIEVHDVFILLKGRRTAEWDDEYERQLKGARNESALQHFEVSRQVKEEEPKDTKEPKEGEQVKQNYMERLKAVILANLQISLHNFHVRFEDDCEPNPFALGVNFRSFTADTTDADFRPAFVHGPQVLLRKLVALTGLNVYLTTKEPLLCETELTSTEWREKMLLLEGAKKDEEYLIKPVDCELKVVLQQGAVVDVQHSRVSAQLVLHRQDFRLHRKQFECIYKAAHYFSDSKKYEKYRRFKPQGGSDRRAKSYWLFACRAVQYEVTSSKETTSWDEISQNIRNLKSYVSIYQKKCQDSNSLSAEEKTGLAQLEVDMSQWGLIEGRKIVYHRLEQLKEEHEKEEETKPKTSGSWWSWGWSTSSPEETNQEQQDEKTNTEKYMEFLETGNTSKLTAEEITKIFDEIGLPEETAAPMTETLPPDYVQYQLRFLATSGTLTLVDGSGDACFTLAQFQFSNICVEYKHREKSYVVSTNVADFSLTNPSPQATVPNVLRRSKGHVAPVSLLTVDFTHQEEDKCTRQQRSSALKVKLLPVTIGIDFSFLGHVVDFFRPRGAYLGSLRKAALKDIGQVVKTAEEQLRLVLEQSNPVDISIVLQQPTIFVSPSEPLPDICMQRVMCLWTEVISWRVDLMEGRANRLTDNTLERDDYFSHSHLLLGDLHLVETGLSVVAGVDFEPREAFVASGGEVIPQNHIATLSKASLHFASSLVPCQAEFPSLRLIIETDTISAQLSRAKLALGRFSLCSLFSFLSRSKSVSPLNIILRSEVYVKGPVLLPLNTAESTAFDAVPVVEQKCYVDLLTGFIVLRDIEDETPVLNISLEVPGVGLTPSREFLAVLLSLPSSTLSQGVKAPDRNHGTLQLWLRFADVKTYNLWVTNFIRNCSTIAEAAETDGLADRNPLQESLALVVRTRELTANLETDADKVSTHTLKAKDFSVEVTTRANDLKVLVEAKSSLHATYCKNTPKPTTLLHSTPTENFPTAFVYKQLVIFGPLSPYFQVDKGNTQMQVTLGDTEAVVGAPLTQATEFIYDTICICMWTTSVSRVTPTYRVVSSAVFKTAVPEVKDKPFMNLQVDIGRLVATLMVDDTTPFARVTVPEPAVVTLERYAIDIMLEVATKGLIVDDLFTPGVHKATSLYPAQIDSGTLWAVDPAFILRNKMQSQTSFAKNGYTMGFSPSDGYAFTMGLEIILQGLHVTYNHNFIMQLLELFMYSPAILGFGLLGYRMVDSIDLVSGVLLDPPKAQVKYDVMYSVTKIENCLAKLPITPACEDYLQAQVRSIVIDRRLDHVGTQCFSVTTFDFNLCDITSVIASADKNFLCSSLCFEMYSASPLPLQHHSSNPRVAPHTDIRLPAPTSFSSYEDILHYPVWKRVLPSLPRFQFHIRFTTLSLVLDEEDYAVLLGCVARNIMHPTKQLYPDKDPWPTFGEFEIESATIITCDLLDVNALTTTGTPTPASWGVSLRSLDASISFSKLAPTSPLFKMLSAVDFEQLEVLDDSGSEILTLTGNENANVLDMSQANLSAVYAGTELAPRVTFTSEPGISRILNVNVHGLDLALKSDLQPVLSFCTAELGLKVAGPLLQGMYQMDVDHAIQCTSLKSMPATIDKCEAARLSEAASEPPAPILNTKYEIQVTEVHARLFDSFLRSSENNNRCLLEAALGGLTFIYATTAENDLKVETKINTFGVIDVHPESVCSNVMETDNDFLDFCYTAGSKHSLLCTVQPFHGRVHTTFVARLLEVFSPPKCGTTECTEPPSNAQEDSTPPTSPATPLSKATAYSDLEATIRVASSVVDVSHSKNAKFLSLQLGNLSFKKQVWEEEGIAANHLEIGLVGLSAWTQVYEDDIKDYVINPLDLSVNILIIPKLLKLVVTIPDLQIALSASSHIALLHIIKAYTNLLTPVEPKADPAPPALPIPDPTSPATPVTPVTPTTISTVSIGSQLNSFSYGSFDVLATYSFHVTIDRIGIKLFQVPCDTADFTTTDEKPLALVQLWGLATEYRGHGESGFLKTSVQSLHVRDERESRTLKEALLPRETPKKQKFLTVVYGFKGATRRINVNFNTPNIVLLPQFFMDFVSMFNPYRSIVLGYKVVPIQTIEITDNFCVKEDWHLNEHHLLHLSGTNYNTYSVDGKGHYLSLRSRSNPPKKLITVDAGLSVTLSNFTVETNGWDILDYVACESASFFVLQDCQYPLASNPSFGADALAIPESKSKLTVTLDADVCLSILDTENTSQSRTGPKALLVSFQVSGQLQRDCAGRGSKPSMSLDLPITGLEVATAHLAPELDNEEQEDHVGASPERKSLEQSKKLVSMFSKKDLRIPDVENCDQSWEAFSRELDKDSFVGSSIENSFACDRDSGNLTDPDVDPDPNNQSGSERKSVSPLTQAEQHSEEGLLDFSSSAGSGNSYLAKGLAPIEDVTAASGEDSNSGESDVSPRQYRRRAGASPMSPRRPSRDTASPVFDKDANSPPSRSDSSVSSLGSFEGPLTLPNDHSVNNDTNNGSSEIWFSQVSDMTQGENFSAVRLSGLSRLSQQSRNSSIEVLDHQHRGNIIRVSLISFKLTSGVGSDGKDATRFHCVLGDTSVRLTIIDVSMIKRIVGDIQRLVSEESQCVHSAPADQGSAPRPQSQESSSAITKGELACPRVVIFLMSDSGSRDYPLFDANLNIGLKFDSSGQSEMDAKLSLELMSHYYNAKLCEWEPFLEKSSVDLTLQRDEGGNELDPSLQYGVVACPSVQKTRVGLNTSFLNFNVTQNLFEVLKEVSQLQTAILEPNRIQSSEQFCQSEVVNCTGIEFCFKSIQTDQNRQTKQTLVTLAHGETAGLNFYSKSSDGQRISCKLSHSDSQWEQVRVDKVGSAFYGTGNLRYLVTVEFSLGRRLVTIGSAVTIVNNTGVIMDVHQVGRIKPAGGTGVVPISALASTPLRVRPVAEGAEYHTAQLGISYGDIYKLGSCRYILTCPPVSVTENPGKSKEVKNDSFSKGGAMERKPQVCYVEISVMDTSTKITFQPTVILSNLAGRTIRYNLYCAQKKQRTGLFDPGFALLRVRSGYIDHEQRVPVTEAPLDCSMFIEIALQQPSGTWLDMKGQECGCIRRDKPVPDTQLTVKDREGRKLIVRLEYSTSNTPSREVELSCPVWIINDTPFYVRFSDRVRNRHSLTAGQLVDTARKGEKSPSTPKKKGIPPKSLTPFLVATPDMLGDSMLGVAGLVVGMESNAHVKIGSGVKWSAGFSTSRIGTVGALESLEIKEGTPSRIVGYSVEFPVGEASRTTKVIRFTPRWVLINKTPHCMYIKHLYKAGAKHYFEEIDPGQSRECYEGRLKGNQMCFKYKSVGEFSQLFDVDDDLDITLNMQTQGGFHVVNVCVYAKGPILFIKFQRLASPPFYIENRLNFQAKVKTSTKEDQWWVIHPRTTAGFAWDDPLSDELQIQVENSTMTVTLRPRPSSSSSDKLQITSSSMKRLSQSILTRARGDTPTARSPQNSARQAAPSTCGIRKCIYFTSDGKEYTVFLKVRYSHADRRTHISMYHDKSMEINVSCPRTDRLLRVHLEGVGLSVVDTTTAVELMYISTRNVSIQALDSVVQVLKLGIENLQIDDQRTNSIHSTIFAASRTGGQQAWMQAKFVRVVDETSPIMRIPSIAFRVASSDLIIEDMFLSDMRDYILSCRPILFGETNTRQGTFIANDAESQTKVETDAVFAESMFSLLARPFHVQKWSFGKVQVNFTLMRTAAESLLGARGPCADPFKPILGAMSVFVRSLHRTPLRWTLPNIEEHSRLGSYLAQLKSHFWLQTFSQFYKFVQVSPVDRPQSVSAEEIQSSSLKPRVRRPRRLVQGKPMEPYGNGDEMSMEDFEIVTPLTDYLTSSTCQRCDQIIAMRKRIDVKKLVNTIENGAMSWAELAHHTTWNEFHSVCTKEQFYIHAEKARDAHIIQGLREDKPPPLVQCTNCREVERIKAQCGDNFEAFKRSVKFYEFAHHTTWDEFHQHTDEESFYLYAHLARDCHWLVTKGFRPIKE